LSRAAKLHNIARQFSEVETMGFALIIFGVAFLLAGYHGTAAKLFDLLSGEFKGTPSFGKWIIAILAVGSIGYIRPLKSLSDSFIVLILVVLFLSNRGFFAKFNAQVLQSNGGGLLSVNNPPIVSNNPFQSSF
jgi:hypothetical protein